jgi:ribosomal protein S18 acetylase RimI-like enzyme
MAMPGLRILKAELADAKEILRLQKIAYQSEAEIYNDFSISPLTQTLEGIEADFKNQVFFKAVFENRIIGSVRAFSKEGTCFIGRLIVHPDFQRQGIGMLLVNEVERSFRESKRFELFTGHKSERNIRFYEKLGYQLFRTETVTQDLNLLFMEKRPEKIE